MTKKQRRNIGVSPAVRCAPFSIPAKKRKRTDYRPLLFQQLRALRLPIPMTEYRFHPVRMWRFDCAWTDLKLALEIEGGVYVAGAHTRGAHFESDCEKYAEATVLGWRVLRVTPRMVKDGRAVGWLDAILLTTRQR